MPPLRVEVENSVHTLTVGEEATFGRDRSCTLPLDATDLGVSRVAGRISEEGGVWWITNLSRKRALHVADCNGFAVPLPVASPGWPPSQRAVDQRLLTVLIPGEKWTYALLLQNAESDSEPVSAPVPTDPHSTRIPALRLTDNRREVLTALSRGYLQPHPDYDPRPRAYEEVAALLGLTLRQVIRRIEDVRDQLIDQGVQGLSGERDNRRALCEWLLAARLVTPADLTWLKERTATTRTSTPKPGPPTIARPRPQTGPRTTFFARLPRNRISYAAQAAAAALAPVLTTRLTQVYGPDWLTTVNARRLAKNIPAGSSLEDERFCLAVFANDEATRGWADNHTRAAAASLKTLADRAAHNRPLANGAAARARELRKQLTIWAKNN